MNNPDELARLDRLINQLNQIQQSNAKEALENSQDKPGMVKPIPLGNYTPNKPAENKAKKTG